MANARSIHTKRWVNELSARGHEIHLITQHGEKMGYNEKIPIHVLPFGSAKGYVLNAWTLRRILSKLKPDLLNAHYASGYGTLATLSGFRPRAISVWGADVFDFPFRSFLCWKLIVCNLQRADAVLSTSEVMARHVETKLSCADCDLTVTPFGVDVSMFTSHPKAPKDEIVIGTVKTLDKKYGIDVLIKAFALANKKNDLPSGGCSRPMRLVIVGGGPERERLIALAYELGIREMTTFVGDIDHKDVPSFLKQMDIFVAVSRLDSESFGVSVVEASACGLPVIVSRVGGLPEVVSEGGSGLIVPKNDEEATAAAITRLADDPSLREEMGKKGRQMMMEKYDWRENVTTMEKAYHRIIEKRCMTCR